MKHVCISWKLLWLSFSLHMNLFQTGSVSEFSYQPTYIAIWNIKKMKYIFYENQSKGRQSFNWPRILLLKQPLTFLSKFFLDFSQYSQEDFSKSPHNFEHKKCSVLFNLYPSYTTKGYENPTIPQRCIHKMRPTPSVPYLKIWISLGFDLSCHL